MITENTMKLAIEQDRAKFFAVADTLHLQPSYAEYVASGELEEVKQTWRDITDLENYPHIDFPLTLPDWFPAVQFTSNFKSTYLADYEAEQAKAEVEQAKAEVELASLITKLTAK